MSVSKESIMATYSDLCCQILSDQLVCVCCRKHRRAAAAAGFLTPYDVDDYANALTRVLGANDAPVFCTLRTRKCCEVFL